LGSSIPHAPTSTCTLRGLLLAMQASIFFAIVVLALRVQAGDPKNGTYDEWKEKQATEAKAAAGQAAREAKMAAVNKVTTMLEDLKSQVLDEGEAEAATYNKFACFCKDTTKEKTEAIKEGEDEKNDLTATIKDLMGTRMKLDASIKELLGDIETAEQEMKEAEAARAKALATYKANEADLLAALEALTGAIQKLKSSKSPSLLQFQSMRQTIKTAMMLADALSIGSGSTQKTISAFLQQAPEVQMEDYKFHSDDIIGTLEKLLDEFRTEKTSVDEAEVKSVQEHTLFMQMKTDLLKKLNHELAVAKKKKAETIASIETNNEQLTTVAATLLDDQEYLKELAKMCHEKALTWDQRSKLRQSELAMLTEVIGIIKASVATNSSAATLRFAQQGTSIRLARAVANSEGAMEAVEAAAEEAEGTPIGFLQSARRSLRGKPNKDGARSVVVELLRQQGSKLKSTLLTALAGKIAADPFAKVKQLIQELIERLLTEASNEANQKGWCDKATKDAEQKRDYAAEEISTLNGKMAELEALIDKLTVELAELTKAIKELEDARAKAEKERKEEKAENAATVAEAHAGLSAINQAIDIISKFYKSAKKEQVDLSLAQGPADDAPDAGFDNGEAYTGAQSESGGIIGMMEVMKSDFERTISETEAAEAQAEEDHLEFMTETGKSLESKKVASAERSTQKDDASEKLDKADENLDEQTKILETSIQELLDLKPVCVDTGMSYKERVARREDEIAALKKADCILSAYEQYGPDGLSDAC